MTVHDFLYLLRYISEVFSRLCFGGLCQYKMYFVGFHSRKVFTVLQCRLSHCLKPYCNHLFFFEWLTNPIYYLNFCIFSLFQRIFSLCSLLCSLFIFSILYSHKIYYFFIWCLELGISR